jgi:hypothetical protein
MPKGGLDGAPLVEEPIDLNERREVAKTCLGALDMSPMTMVIDGMDDAVSTRWQGFPDRLYLVDGAGKVAYAGGKGPRDFDPNGLEDAIRVLLKLPELERAQQPRRRRGR